MKKITTDSKKGTIRSVKELVKPQYYKHTKIDRNQYVINLRKKGYSYTEIVRALEKEWFQSTTVQNIQRICKTYKKAL